MKGLSGTERWGWPRPAPDGCKASSTHGASVGDRSGIRRRRSGGVFRRVFRRGARSGGNAKTCAIDAPQGLGWHGKAFPPGTKAHRRRGFSKIKMLRPEHRPHRPVGKAGQGEWDSPPTYAAMRVNGVSLASLRARFVAGRPTGRQC